MSCEIQCEILKALGLEDQHVVSADISFDKDFISVKVRHYAVDSKGNFYLEGDDIKTLVSEMCMGSSESWCKDYFKNKISH